MFDQCCYVHTKETVCETTEDVCGICLETMKVQYRSACCKQAFCRACMKKHKQAGGTACPACRAPIGYTYSSTEYKWANLKHKTKLLQDRVQALTYLTSHDALSVHIKALMDKQKDDALKMARRAYREQVQEINAVHTNTLSAWIDNRDGYRDSVWNYATTVNDTLSNLSLLQQSTRPTALLAKSGIDMVKEANDILDSVMETDDILGIYGADDDDEAGLTLEVVDSRASSSNRSSNESDDDDDTEGENGDEEGAYTEDEDDDDYEDDEDDSISLNTDDEDDEDDEDDDESASTDPELSRSLISSLVREIVNQASRRFHAVGSGAAPSGGERRHGRGPTRVSSRSLHSGPVSNDDDDQYEDTDESMSDMSLDD
jgi:hypothetical protein